jgi:hypothetical protein
VRTSGVIVVDKLLKYSLKLTRPEDKEMVEHLPTHSPYPPLRVRIRSRSSKWYVGDLDSLGHENRVEGIAELAVTIVKEMRRREDAILKVPGQIPSLLSHPLSGRVR